MAIKINLGTLKEGSQNIELETDAEELGIEKEMIKDTIKLNMDIAKTSNQIDMRINITSMLLLECDRCLERYEFPININHELIFVQKGSREIDSPNDNEDDYLKFYSPFMKSVDITQDLKEFVLLSVPMRKIPEFKDDKCVWCGRTEEYFKKFLTGNEEEENQ